MNSRRRDNVHLRVGSTVCLRVHSERHSSSRRCKVRRMRQRATPLESLEKKSQHIATPVTKLDGIGNTPVERLAREASLVKSELPSSSSRGLLLTPDTRDGMRYDSVRPDSVTVGRIVWQHAGELVRGKCIRDRPVEMRRYVRQRVSGFAKRQTHTAARVAKTRPL